MESSCDKVYKLSLFNNCEVASGKFEPYIHRSESLFTTNHTAARTNSYDLDVRNAFKAFTDDSNSLKTLR